MTLTTYPLGKLEVSAAKAASWLAQDDALNRLFAGIFHEGVFISPVDGWRGAHAQEWIQPPDYQAIQRIDACSGGRVRVVNVAPEQPGGLDFIEQAVRDGKQVALGHCGPDAETVHEAVRRGATLVTHFGNGAPGQIHRHKNPLWAFLNDPKLRLGLICDGFHLPPDLIGAALRCKGAGGCFAVSDAASFAGSPPGAYLRPDGRPFTIETDGLTHMNNRDVLAGSWFQQDRSVEILVSRVGLSLPEAWRLCSEVPAAIIGEKLPALAAGEEASFVLARMGDRLLIEQSVHLGVPFLKEPVGTGVPKPVR
jgi:N-acetylglucosamine-6-phosphate deacetylase